MTLRHAQGHPEGGRGVTCEIERDGKRHGVALRREGTLWVAGLDGREVAVSIVEIGGRWSMLLGPPEGGPYDNDVVSGFPGPPKLGTSEGGSRTSYEIAFEPGTGGELVVHVNGAAVQLTILDRQRPARRGGPEAGADTQPRTIVAPMPGRIVKVLVKPDEVVSARQPLVVVEAMKMENELRAPRAGIVAEVRVAEGASVEANTVLVVLR